MRRRFSYNKETSVADVVLYMDGITATGTAKVHPDDLQYANEYTGLHLAELRAYKKYLEKRARKKHAYELKLLRTAQYYKKLCEEDMHTAQQVEAAISEFINGKALLYQTLKNPPKKVQWHNLPENFFKGEELNEQLGTLEQSN